LFFHGAVQYYFLPGEPFKSPFPSRFPFMRLGGGYGLPLGPGLLSLGLEIGFDRLDVDPPSGYRSISPWADVLPVSFKGTYDIPLGNRFTLGGGFVGGGFIDFAQDVHPGFTPFIGPRLYAGLRLGDTRAEHTWLAYFGGGADFAFQTEKTVLLPSVGLGIRYTLGKKSSAAVPVTDPGSAAQTPGPKMEPGDHPLVTMQDGRRGFILIEFSEYFAPNQSDLSNEDTNKLDHAAVLLQFYSGSRIMIAGYTALAGTAEGREAVSRARAEQVASYLAGKGISQERMEVGWFGADYLARTTAAQNMALNRRAEIVVLLDN
jgi:outer membrane protein OmpA-like peptidoglycan-associated protein